MTTERENNVHNVSKDHCIQCMDLTACCLVGEDAPFQMSPMCQECLEWAAERIKNFDRIEQEKKDADSKEQ